jgi:hypothetical protein
MRTTFFFFAMLASVAASAQSTVQILPISATYTTSPTVKFRVSWTNQSTAGHPPKVWIIIDYDKVENNTAAHNWQPAAITGAVQKTAGTVSQQSARGFFLEGTTTGFSSDVTVSLSGMPAKFNWCAFALDYPPNATVKAGGGYDLHGSPPFTVNGAQLGAGVTTFGAGTCITSITDATGNPAGLVPALPTVTASAPSSACSGTAVTFTATASGSTTTAMTYTWNIAGSLLSTTATTYSKALSSTGSNTYSVSVKNSNECVSSVSSVKTITINTGATRDNATNTCGCAAGLTACNGYCRDLDADQATCVSNIEVYKTNASCRIYPSRNPAKTDWWWATQDQLQTLYNAGYLACAGKTYWTSTVLPSGPWAVAWVNCTWRTYDGFSTMVGECVYVR